MENWKTLSLLEYALCEALMSTVTPSGTCRGSHRLHTNTFRCYASLHIHRNNQDFGTHSHNVYLQTKHTQAQTLFPQIHMLPSLWSHYGAKNFSKWSGQQNHLPTRTQDPPHSTLFSFSNLGYGIFIVLEYTFMILFLYLGLVMEVFCIALRICTLVLG